MKVATLVAQSYVRRILENERDNLKLAWIIIMGGALTEASIELSKVLPCFINYIRSGFLGYIGSSPFIPLSVQTKAIIGQMCFDGAHPAITFLFFFLFLLTLLRFLWGDNRLIDAKYVEVISFINDGTKDEIRGNINGYFKTQFQNVINSFRRVVLVFDILFVILHGVIFLFLAKNLNNHDVFVFLYIFLLLFNAFWLILTWISSRRRHYDFWKEFVKDDRVGDVTALAGPWRWAANNIAHAIIISLLLYKLQDVVQFLRPEIKYIRDEDYWNWAAVLAVLMFLSNCLFDFALTWSVYFPRIGRIYKDLVSE
jgi:hypothetical protein